MKTGFEEIEHLYDHKSHITGVPTGFPDLDKILAGMHRGDLIILAARPSVGKTALALNIAVNAAKAGASTAIFSLEMSASQLVQRILCAEARVDSQKLRTGYLADEDWPALMQAMGRLGSIPLWVDDTPSISILEVRAKARRLLRDQGQKLIVLDYLQLMQPHGRRSENRQVEIAEISRGLKILAKELDCPILALSQLSRAVEQRTSKRPQLSDLRESGAIEQDADVVMFIDRNTDPTAEAEGNRPGKGEAEIIVAKHRNGPVDSCRLAYLERITRFMPLARTP
jgi:replicative DNA helicase